uniref:Putative DNA primase n=1 Tax=viral metagenome TaxID=1070528 RepID=A0A6M3L458_9ZZZZ
MGITELLEDKGIDYVREGKHAARGWIQVECPYCTGNPGFHGGFNLESIYYHCWRCGWHPMSDVLSELLGLDIRDAKHAMNKYDVLSPETRPPFSWEARPIGVRLPPAPPTYPPVATEYIESRGFKWEDLREWGVYATGYTGRFRLRLVAPVYLVNGNIVSYITRDVTGKAEAKYLPCPKEAEVVPHKHILYGSDRAPLRNVIVVEGVADVWRLGPGAMATFGIDYTPKQLLYLARNFNNIAIMFDNEELAQLRAAQLAVELEGLGKHAIQMKCKEKDPAEMSREEAIQVMEDLPGIFESWYGYTS